MFTCLAPRMCPHLYHPARYGQHLTKEEVEAFTAPHSSSVDAVNDWLEFHGVDSSTAHRSPAGEWVTIVVSVAEAERMLGTKYNVYHHAKSGQDVVRTLGYSLPKELHSHVDVVAPTTYFGTLRSMKSTSFVQHDVKPMTPAEVQEASLVPVSNAVVPTTCTRTITPACLRALYNTSTYVPTQTATNKLGVAGYLGEFANTADLQVSFLRFLIDYSRFMWDPCHRLSTSRSALMPSAPASASSLLTVA